MKSRRFAALVLTVVLLAGHSAPAFASSRDTASRERSLRQLVVKVVKQLRDVFKISAQDDPTPPKPCQTGCP